jgi:flagellin-specific chaperone FliS
MSYVNYRYDENDRKLEETLKRLPKNFNDFMKRHKQEMIQLYQNEFNSALRLTEECIKRGDIIEANLHLERARHARDLIKLEKEDLDNF